MTDRSNAIVSIFTFLFVGKGEHVNFDLCLVINKFHAWLDLRKFAYFWPPYRHLHKYNNAAKVPRFGDHPTILAWRSHFWSPSKSASFDRGVRDQLCYNVACYFWLKMINNSPNLLWLRWLTFTLFWSPKRTAGNCSRKPHPNRLQLPWHGTPKGLREGCHSYRVRPSWTEFHGAWQICIFSHKSPFPALPGCDSGLSTYYVNSWGKGESANLW